MKNIKENPKITVIIGSQQATVSKKLLSSKLQYFDARLSAPWTNNDNTNKIIISDSDDLNFDLESFSMLLSNINNNRQLNIPTSLDPNKLLMVIECANFFAILNNNSSLILQQYYARCTKVITNQQLQLWSTSRIRIFSGWARKQLKQRKVDTFKIIISKLDSICNRAQQEDSGEIYFESLLQSTSISKLSKEFDAVLSALTKTIDFSWDGNSELIISKLYQFAVSVSSRNCSYGFCLVGHALLIWLLNIRSDAINSNVYVKCILLLVNNYRIYCHSPIDRRDIFLEKDPQIRISIVEMWVDVAVSLLHANYPNCIQEVVIAWKLICDQPKLVQKIFNAVNNQQGHELALFIFESYTFCEKSKFTQQYLQFCSKYCD